MMNDANASNAIQTSDTVVTKDTVTPEAFERMKVNVDLNLIMEEIFRLGIKNYALRSCSICECPIFYCFAEFDGAKRVGFDANCDCSAYDSGIRERSWYEFAEHFNIQTPEIREKCLRELFKDHLPT